MEQREFVVEQETAGQRIDRFLSGEDKIGRASCRERV